MDSKMKSSFCVGTILLLLVVQNATQTLLMRYSRGVLNETYNATSAVFVVELCKMTVCCFMLQFNIGLDSDIPAKNPSLSNLFYLIRNSGYSWMPAFCYFIQNSLQYVASKHLSTSVYAVLQQTKIVSAAIFSYIVLNRSLQWRQWRALLLLVTGAILMETHNFAIYDDQNVLLNNNNDPIIGSFAMLAIVTLSGVAGVLTEKLLKNKGGNENGNTEIKLNIWERNIQFSFWGIVGCIFWSIYDTEWYYNGNGMFGGWSMITCLLVVVWTAGGLLVAMTIKYTDVVIKGFASAISLILICFCGSLLLNDYLDTIFFIGAVVTIIATMNYKDVNKINVSIPIEMKTTNDHHREMELNHIEIDGNNDTLGSEIKPLIKNNTD